MRFLSLFSGIEAASVALCPKGWECVGVAEIDKAASRLLARHYPDAPNLGDVSRITEQDVKALGRIDVIIFGSPCQDLSVAGKRKGLAGARSGLFIDAMRVVGWARAHCGLRWAWWENVPGCFSSNKGRDFAVVVGELAGCGDVGVPANGWGSEGCAVGDHGLVEWAVLDAQWFGLAQRRKRVFAVADFGDWPGRPPILLERQSLRGDPPSRSGQGQGAAYDVAPSLTASGRGVERTGETRGPDPVVGVRRVGLGLEPVGFNSKDYGQDAAEGLSPTLRASGHADSWENGGAPPAIAYSFNGRQDPVHSEAVTGALDTDPATQCIAFALRGREGGAMPEGFSPMASALRAASGGSTRDYVACVTGDVAHTLKAEGFDASEDGTGRGQPIVNEGSWAVRRLTPTECERLQGFPDGYTAGQADGPRYKQLGNSMATPVLAWIGERIMLAELMT